MAPASGNFQVERTAHMQRFDVGQPGEGDFILRPDARNQDRNLVLVGAIERPIVQRGQTLHHIDRMFGAVGDKVLAGRHS